MINFTKKLLLEAIEEIDSNPKLRNKRNSSTYDLIYKDVKYPPILVLSIANQLKGGKELLLSDFNNNVEIPFKILKDLGFTIDSKSKSLKDEFERWLKKKHKKDSGAVSSYIRSIEILSNLFFANNKINLKDIFQISDLKILNTLYSEVLKHQKNKDSYLYYSKAPGYGENNFLSASLKNYIDFITSKNMENPTSFIHEFNVSVKNSNLNFSSELILRFTASLTSKPFVILSGLSGSGKTKIAQSFVQWICEKESQYKIVPVGADWTNREPLLGYPNGLNAEEYVTPDSGVLHLLLEASKLENQNKPHFIILDEMNLSHVERYFADFLSIMESKDSIKLYSGRNRVSLDKKDIPQEIGWPKNVFIIGTVNIDETTYMFSPKVLDRANVIEFRITEEEIATFFTNNEPLKMKKLLLDEDDKTKGGAGQAMAEGFLSIAATSEVINNDGITSKLTDFFAELKKVGAEFGYRTANEMLLLITKLKTLDETISDDKCLDIAIMQKLLPKLHGSRSKLVKVLIALAALCIDNSQQATFIKEFDQHFKNDFVDVTVVFDISFEKLMRMYKNVLANGFTSYAEA